MVPGWTLSLMMVSKVSLSLLFPGQTTIKTSLLTKTKISFNKNLLWKIKLVIGNIIVQCSFNLTKWNLKSWFRIAVDQYRPGLFHILKTQVRKRGEGSFGAILTYFWPNPSFEGLQLFHQYYSKKTKQQTEPTEVPKWPQINSSHKTLKINQKLVWIGLICQIFLS